MPTAMLFHRAGAPLEAVPQKLAALTGTSLRVKVLCCTLCRSDISTFTGRRLEATPTILGHEVVGEITEFGPDATHFDSAGEAAQIGDRVTWAVVAACGECFFCQHDLPQKCSQGTKYGHIATTTTQPDGGGLADLVTLVPGTAWFRVPDTLSTPVASLANCTGGTVAAMLEAAGPLSGRTLMVFGAGILGLMACAMATQRQAIVIAVDPNPESRERALAFGAVNTLDPTNTDFASAILELTEGRGADVALELAGVSASAEAAVACLRIGGTAILGGTVTPTTAFPLDPEKVVRRMLTIKGVHNYHPRHLQAALAFLAGPGQAFPFADLIAGTFPLDQTEAAFAAAGQNPGRRIAVVPAQ